MSAYEVLSVLSSIAAGVVALATCLVSWRIYQLQKSVKDAKKPFVHIWYNGTKRLLPKLSAEMSFANLGQTPLLVRRLRLLGGDGQAMSIAMIYPERLSSNRDRSYSTVAPKHNQEVVDLVFEPGQVQGVSFEIEVGQLKVEVMYYDNTFEFIEIDTSILGGKYALTGKGKKYG